MKFLCVFVALFVAVNGQTGDNDVNPQGCGQRPIDSNFITGGVESINSAHPWIVSIEYGTGSSFNHFCGAAILNRRWVITAAHCVYGLSNINNFRLKIGAHDRGLPNSWTQIRSIDKIIMHASYAQSTKNNDIALLRLSTAVQYNYPFILPACIFEGNVSTMTPGETEGVAAGWGTTSSGSSTVPAILREVRLKLTPTSDITAIYGPDRINSTTMICFGLRGDGMDTCQGDSGGPLIVKFGTSWKLVGLTSFGKGCGDVGVYTSVSNYGKWIRDQIAANTEQ